MESEKVIFYGTLPLIFLLTTVLISSVRLIKKVFKASDHQKLTLFYLLTWISVPTYIYYFTGLRPEIFLLILGSMCAYFSCRESFVYGRFEKIFNPILLGFLVGIGIATKVTFLSFLGLFLLINGPLRKLLFFATIPPTFVLFTWPIKDQYANFFSWIKDILSHTGSYGTGPAGLPGLSLLFEHSKIMLSSYFLLFVLIFFVFSFLLSRFSIRNFFRDRETRTIFVFMAIMLVQLSMSMKHPNIRYFLPAMTLLPWMVVFSFNSVKRSIFQKFHLILFSILIPVSIGQLILQFQPEIRESAEIAKIETIAKKDGCYVFELNGGGIGTALAFGNIWAAYAHNSSLAIVHRQRMISGVYSGSITDPGNTYIFQDQDYKNILSKGCLMVMSRTDRKSVFGLDVSPIFQGQYFRAFNVEQAVATSNSRQIRAPKKM